MHVKSFSTLVYKTHFNAEKIGLPLCQVSLNSMCWFQVQNVISTQQSQLKTSPVDDHDHGTNKKRRRSSLDDPGLAKLKKTNSGEALTVPATVPLVPSADPIYGQISLEDYVLDGDSDFSSQDDCASLGKNCKSL